MIFMCAYFTFNWILTSGGHSLEVKREARWPQIKNFEKRTSFLKIPSQKTYNLIYICKLLQHFRFQLVEAKIIEAIEVKMESPSEQF